MVSSIAVIYISRERLATMWPVSLSIPKSMDSKIDHIIRNI